tara:strand:- start:480 stop:641 length:162 start_codon:yes stop_codon:yes gene_type:complete
VALVAVVREDTLIGAITMLIPAQGQLIQAVVVVVVFVLALAVATEKVLLAAQV